MNNIQKVLDCILTPLQDVEDALQQCLTERTVETATGVNLEVLGKLVGEPRGTFTDDDDYRRAIRARIAANRSSGTVEEMLAVARLIINDAAAHYQLHHQGRAQQLLRVQDVATSDELALMLLRFVEDTQSAGVRTIVQYGTAAPSTWAVFDDAAQGFDTHVFVGSVD